MADVDTKAIREQLTGAHDLVHALCQPRGTKGSREWIMSIPARPDYDPDIVIGTALRAALALCDALDAEREKALDYFTALDSERRAVHALKAKGDRLAEACDAVAQLLNISDMDAALDDWRATTSAPEPPSTPSCTSGTSP